MWWMTLRPTIVDPQVESAIRRLVRVLQSVPGMQWVTYSGVEFTANVAMFVPLGLLVVAWGGRWWHGILGGLVVSAGIETWQLLMLPGRVADVRDLVANTLGAALGIGAAVVFSRWLARSQEAHSPRHRKVIDSPSQ
ncbi:glycopeptide antibiotics resistance protein [Microbacterium proteolyticum]|uniref:Glycopeptide antibiotics resistance protein n=1 Tax=Microbacterium proteolyticum TaxID=1572644 RepID=A0A7W5GG53_9MICO|nr:glycopeptide antibiotics resistance protein [Microbacterium proteolyticum]